MSEHGFSAAQTKACIVAASQEHGLAIEGETFHLIEAPSAVLCEATLGLPPEVDIVFSLDLTGSMGGEIARVKAEVNQVIDGLRAAAPDTDFRFGVVSYEDYPGLFNSSACPDSEYAAIYGYQSAGDLPFRINLPITGDAVTVASTINGLQLGNGGDGPQSYGRVFWEIAQADTAAALGFRPDALKLLIDFGDNVPHDADLNAGLEPPVIPPVASPFDTGYDPGQNGVIDCGGDDIDLQDDALSSMAAADIRLVHVDSSGDPDLEDYWKLWAGLTGGEYAAINPDGTIPGGLDLTDLIIELLQQVA